MLTFERPNGTVVRIDSGVTSCVASWDARGEATARIAIAAAAASDDLYASRVTIYDRAAPVWTGRVENIENDGKVATITAYGAWRVLGDARYTAFWSTRSTSRWREASQEEAPLAANGRYQIDFNNRVYISPRQGEVHGNSDRHVAYTAFRGPQFSRTAIRHVSFSWNVDLPGDAGRQWDYFLLFKPWHPPSVFEPITFDWSPIFSGSGVASGTFMHNSVPDGALVVLLALRVFNITPPPLNAGTDRHFARATNVRLAAKTPPVRSSDIARDVIAAAREGNEFWIVGGAVEETNDDVVEALYEDADPREVLETLARRINYVPFCERGTVAFRSQSSIDAHAQKWTVSPRVVSLARGVEDVATRVYATYRAQDDNETLRTATIDAPLVSVGFRRTRVVDARTTSLTTAEAVRNAYALTQRDLSTRIRVRARERDLLCRGTPTAGAIPRAYDSLDIEGAPLPTAARIGSVAKDFLSGELDIELLSPANTLENALQ